MLVTITINVWWLVWLAMLAYLVVSVLGVRQAAGFVASEIRLYRRYGKRYTLWRYMTWSMGYSWRWVFLPAHLLTYGLGWLRARRTVGSIRRSRVQETEI